MKVNKAWFDKQFNGADGKLGDKWGHRWKGSQKHRHAQCLAMIRGYVEDGDGLPILDAGCALGDFTNMVFDLNHSNSVSGVDISEDAVRIANCLHANINYSVGALPHVDGQTESMDIITALEVIGYLDNDSRRLALGNIYRMLKPNGYFLFSGGINRGTGYFEPNSILHVIGDVFDVTNVKYNYDYLYKRWENVLVGVGLGRAKWVAALLGKVSKWLWGNKRATHIFVLASKTKGI